MRRYMKHFELCKGKDRREQNTKRRIRRWTMQAWIIKRKNEDDENKCNVIFHAVLRVSASFTQFSPISKAGSH